jgi:hypothetical protein
MGVLCECFPQAATKLGKDPNASTLLFRYTDSAVPPTPSEQRRRRLEQDDLGRAFTQCKTFIRFTLGAKDVYARKRLLATLPDHILPARHEEAQLATAVDEYVQEVVKLVCALEGLAAEDD